MKKNLTFAAIIISLLCAGAAKATTYTASSCTASAFNSALSTTKDGDVVLGPSGGGSATWSTMVLVNFGITLVGNGCAITFASPGGLTVTPDVTASTFVTGFTFQQGFINGGCPIWFGITSSTLPFRFYGNTLTDNGSQGPVTMICVGGLGQGLIDHNAFTFANGADEVIHILGQGAGVDTWTDSLTPGSANMLFIETNTFTNTSTGANSAAEEAYYGAEFVFRYNTLTVMGNDMHDGDGARWGEIYENTYNLNSSCVDSNFAQIRGGSGVFWGNSHEGSPGCDDPYPGTSIGPDCPGSSDTCSGTWPVPKQIGRGINETTYSPLYLWGNDSVVSNSIYASGNESLVAVGTAPTDATNCTIHPGDVCDAVSLSSAPTTLEVCQSAANVTAGCPVNITYTPYQYPHPLTYPQSPGSVTAQAY